jgi:hypothetical protein
MLKRDRMTAASGVRLAAGRRMLHDRGKAKKGRETTRHRQGGF